MDRRRALCRTQDPERWFPISQRAAEIDDEPIAVCNLCPIQAECLQEAMERGYDHGTWGGYTEWQRRSMKRHGIATALVLDVAAEAASKAPERVG